MEAMNTDPLKMQPPRKDTGQSINNETDSSDEEDNRAKHRDATGQHNPETRDIPVIKSLDISVTKGIRYVKIIETTGCSRSVERTPKAQPFNPESNSSEDSDILDPDETQPKTGIPHPIQETRP